MSRTAIIEGLLFMSGEEGLSLVQIQSVLQELSREEILNEINSIKRRCEQENHGFELVEYASRYKFVTKESIYPYAKRLYENLITPTLSQAAMETLAIIAYKGPITRVQIEEIRGVSCEMMLKKLVARDMIEAKDRLDAIGKPLLYTVTQNFLDAFELDSLQALPEIEIKETKNELFES
ncbi:SMC-Scp complex subunit ScpB [Dubosiella newyorkensis]|jgi:segregation and condensation protein B|uniref:SMC-Scp complex subunit ScpB n=2 Tax=Dubosiella newyorkensis TaxID=1862672 RepID=UPI002355ACB1|nr:SMC-Scp complex subunit ScpB [Dubosiella newyorkensis]MCI9040601.1 SMC-Scp complex subunit ScpB [Dubosiella newyorkensis]